MQKKRILIALGAIVVIGGWYAFRPERLVIDQRVDEPLAATVQQAGGAMASGAMADANVAVASGTFHSVHHETSGTATVYRRADGTRVLRFTNFATSNGPDVRIYLVAAPDAPDNETVTKAGFIELGAMKGNQGDQNYDLPETVDLAKYRAVTIWCRRFSVNFATAPLSASPSA